MIKGLLDYLTGRALKADKDMKDATQKQKKIPPCRVTGKGKQIRSTGATSEGVKLNKQ